MIVLNGDVDFLVVGYVWNRIVMFYFCVYEIDGMMWIGNVWDY